MTLREDLLRGSAFAAVWGSGAVGATTVAYYAQAGVHMIAYDTNPEVVNAISHGTFPIPSLEDHLGISIAPLLKKGLIESTIDAHRILDDPRVKLHFLAIPTERHGEPWSGALAEVAYLLTEKKRVGRPELIVVESTLAPGYGDKFVIKTLESAGLSIGQDFLFAVAPRRDWFVSKDKNLQTLPRIVGATDEASLHAATQVLRLVCKQIVPVSSYRVAELVKPLENAFRAINIAFVDEVTRAFPDLDVREAILAAATKWNFMAHDPGAGIGGHCIPLAPKYLLAGLDSGSPELQLIKSFSTSVSEHTRYIADTLHRAADGGVIMLLGLAYKEELKVHTLSPTLEIAERLRGLGADFRVHDPLYSPQEIRAVVDVEPAIYPNDLGSASVIAVLVGHRLYRSLSERDAILYLRPGTSILDIEGIWQRLETAFRNRDIRYRLLGSTNWNRFT